MNGIRIKLDKGGVESFRRENISVTSILTGDVVMRARSGRAHTTLELSLGSELIVDNGAEQQRYPTETGEVEVDLTTDALSSREEVLMEALARAIARGELTGPSAVEVGRQLFLHVYQHDETVHGMVRRAYPHWAQVVAGGM